MPTLQADDIADLVTGTLRDLGRLKLTEIASPQTHYTILPMVMRKKKAKFDSGYGIQRNLLTAKGDAAKNVGLFAKDTVNVGDYLKTINIPWRHTTTNWSYDAREIAMNSGASKIVDEIKSRRLAAGIDLVDRFEKNGWERPADSTDKTEPYGIPLWIVQNDTTGFNGKNPQGFTTGIGLDSTVVTKWANYSMKYTNVTKDDLIKKLRECVYKTDFMSPVDGLPGFEMPSYETKDPNVHYTNFAVSDACIDLMEAQNDNLGSDLHSQDGKLVFRRNQVVTVPYLDDRTNNPWYGIAWSCMRVVLLEGWYLKDSGALRAPDQHTVYHHHVDLSYNFLCDNRRKQFVVTTGAASPYN